MKSLRTEFAAALFGSLLLFASFPPLSLAPLAWVAPLLWLRSVARDPWPGWRAYGELWVAGWVFWALAIHWIRLPHPLNWFGWLALTAYLACYLPIFIALCRVARLRWRVPLWLAAPVVWTGLELARAHLLTGFLMASLAHTQFAWTRLIQISDLVGEYGVSFLVMTVAGSLWTMAWSPGQRAPGDRVSPWSRWRCLLPAIASLALALFYGHYRLHEPVDDSDRRAPRVALVQGNIAAEWKADQDRQRMIMRQHIRLSQRALEAGRLSGGLDLIVWPETMYRNPLLTFEDRDAAPPELRQTADLMLKELANLVELLDNTPLLVGLDRWHLSANALALDESTQFYNSVTLVDTSGRVAGYYDKMQRVMFGEYIPLAAWFPWLYRLTPLTGGIEAGRQPVALEVDGIRYAPNICYESVLPHVIRQHVVELAAQGRPADVLVNVTNDAWFWGSSELDMHLACGVFRTIETRRPLLIAANGGISAAIDANGTIRQQSPRQQQDVIIAEVLLDGRESPYVRYGDWFAMLCLICCLVLGGYELVARRSWPSAPTLATAR